ncbi:MAG: hypothetical protein AAF568_07895, partial [Pseudomonadota bacterium]
VQAKYREAEAFGHRIAAKLDDNHANMVAHYIIGAPLTWRGQFRDGREALAKGERFGDAHFAETAPNRRDLAGLAQIYAMRAVVEAYLGNGSTALQYGAQGIDLAQKTGQPLTLANAVHMACIAHQTLNHPDAMSMAQQLSDVSEACGYPFYTASTKCHLGGALLHKGVASEGYKLLQEGWLHLEEIGTRASAAYVRAELARGCLMLGRLKDGLQHVSEGLAHAAAFDERNFEAELHRIRGQLLEASGAPSGEVRAAYANAVYCARTQGAALFELRASMLLSAVSGAGEDPDLPNRLALLRDRLSEPIPSEHP